MANVSVSIFVGNFSLFCSWVVSGAYLTYFAIWHTWSRFCFPYVHPSVPHPVKPGPQDSFPSSSENLASSLPGEILILPGQFVAYSLQVLHTQCISFVYVWKTSYESTKVETSAKRSMGILWIRARMCTRSIVRSSVWQTCSRIDIVSFSVHPSNVRFSRRGRSCFVLLLS